MARLSPSSAPSGMRRSLLSVGAAAARFFAQYSLGTTLSNNVSPLPLAHAAGRRHLLPQLVRPDIHLLPNGTPRRAGAGFRTDYCTDVAVDRSSAVRERLEWRMALPGCRRIANVCPR